MRRFIILLLLIIIIQLVMSIPIPQGDGQQGQGSSNPSGTDDQFNQILQQVQTIVPKDKIDDAFKISLDITLMGLSNGATSPKDDFLYRFTLYYGAFVQDHSLAPNGQPPTSHDDKTKLVTAMTVLDQTVKTNEDTRRAYMDWFQQVKDGDTTMKGQYDQVLNTYIQQCQQEQQQKTAAAGSVKQ